MITENYFIIQKFNQHIRNQNIIRFKMAEDLGLHHSHIYRVLNNKRELSNNLRQKLNEYLGTDF